MALNTLKIRMTVRGDTAQNWTDVNPVLLLNEEGRETDTGRIKYGDGVTAWNDLPYFGEGDATTISYDNPDYPTVAAALDKLLYVNVNISSFANNVNTVEMGSTVTSVTLTWNYTGKPTSVKLDNEEVGTSAKSKAYTSQNITSNKTYTLVATDGTTSSTRTTSISFLNGVYYGIGDATDPTDTFIKGLTKNLATSKAKTFTVTAGSSKYIYYAFPARFGTPTFSVGGFEGGFALVKTFNYTNPSGYSESYVVYRSDNDNLGQTTVVVK